MWSLITAATEKLNKRCLDAKEAGSDTGFPALFSTSSPALSTAQMHQSYRKQMDGKGGHLRDRNTGDFAAGPVVKTPSFRCKGCGFD